jgi:hypothetical protein
MTFVDHWGALDRMPIGRPTLVFKPGSLVADVVRALAGRAEIECVFHGTGNQTIGPVAMVWSPELTTIGHALELIQADFGWSMSFDSEGRLNCYGHLLRSGL